MGTEEFKKLWNKYTTGQASPEEVKELLHFISQGKGDAWIEEYINNLDPQHYQQIDLQQSEWDNIWNRIIPGSDQQVMSSVEDQSPTKRMVSMFVRYGGWAVAASLIIAITINSLRRTDKSFKPAETEIASADTHFDLKPPSSVNAILTLANGKTIVLDSVQKGEAIRLPGAKIIKLADGRVRYEEVPSGISDVQYNTLSVPRGSKIVELILGDGSLVVLNAASSITYPTAFTGDQRTVQISGEAYFEVAKNKAKPFIVTQGSTRVEVLGTHFNVNAYEDEKMTNVTLLEGSVRVSQTRNNKNILLRPGQGAQVDNDIRLVTSLDIDEVMAWRAGKFKFGENESIEMVMRQISRWYDVEIEYEGTIKGHIGGTISRQANVSQVLKLLEMTGVVKFKYDEKKIKVMQNK